MTREELGFSSMHAPVLHLCIAVVILPHKIQSFNTTNINTLLHGGSFTGCFFDPFISATITAPHHHVAD